MPPAAATKSASSSAQQVPMKSGGHDVRRQLAGVGAAHQLVEFFDAQAAGVGVELAERRCPFVLVARPEPGGRAVLRAERMAERLMIVQRREQLHAGAPLELGNQPSQPAVWHEHVAVDQADQLMPRQANPLTVRLRRADVGRVFYQADPWIALSHPAQEFDHLRLRAVVDDDQLERAIGVVQERLQAEPDMRQGIPDLHDDADGADGADGLHACGGTILGGCRGRSFGAGAGVLYNEIDSRPTGFESTAKQL